MNADLLEGGRARSTRPDQAKERTKLDEERIKSLLFKQVERPKGLWEIRITNVFDNRYRINLWVRLEEDGLTKNKIGASYFAILEGDELRIRA